MALHDKDYKKIFAIKYIWIISAEIILTHFYDYTIYLSYERE